MSLVSQSIESLVGGVSQETPSQRDPSRVSEQVNCLSHPVYGLIKRPPAVKRAKLSASLAGQSAFIHEVTRQADDRYTVIVADGDLRVYDQITDYELEVVFPAGRGYLSSGDPKADFAAVTVDDATYILNRNVYVRRGVAKSPAARNEALVAIRQADFSTFYQISLDSTNVQITTSDGSSAPDRRDISTERIATQLRSAIAASSALAAFSVVQYGSTLYITRTDGADFSISASDGLADEGILAIKGTVQRFEDLPERARKGFTVEVTGDPTNRFDNYYVTYDDNGAPNLSGVWRETARPATLTALDGTTMPFMLSRRGSVIDGVEAKGIPGPPTIEPDTATVFYAGWNKRGDLGTAGSEGHYGAHDPNVQLVLNDHMECFSSTLGSLNGSSATIRANFDVDTRSMLSGSQCTVKLYVSNAPSTGNVATADMTLAASRTYNQGATLYNEFIEVSGEYPANTQIELLLKYNDEAQPANKLKVAKFRLHTKSDDANCSIVATISTAARVTYLPDVIYPAGAVTTLTVSSTDSTRTSSSDETGVQAALALKTLLIAAGCAVTVVADGALRVSKASVAPSLAVKAVVDGSVRLYNPDMGLVVNALVGKIIENQSDGSTGTITSNTESQILVTGGLTGGVNNTFSRGDICRVVGADTSFSFQPVQWKQRAAGDLDTNPDPSFVGRRLNTIFFHKDRLGVTSGENVVLTKSGDYANFFRQTVTDVLTDDMIDVRAASDTLSYFHSASEWNGWMLLWADNGQYLLSGEPALSPQTVSIQRITQFSNSPKVRPLSVGRRAVFARGKNGATQIWEMAVMNQTGTPDAHDTTSIVPRYLKGNPLAIAGDAAEGVLVVLTDDDRSVLYVQNFAYDGDNKVQESWHRWQFAGAIILGLSMNAGRLDMIVSLADGVYLETIDLTIGPSDTAGSFVDHSGSAFAATYTSRADLSTIFLRTPRYGQRSRVETAGRLTVRNLIIHYAVSRSFTAIVTAAGNSLSTAYASEMDSGDAILRVPVMQRNTDFSYSITSSSADGFRISSVDWEGTYNVGLRRV